MKPTSNPLFGVDELRGDDYLITIFDDIVPAVVDATASVSNPEKTAMLGSSMGGLATLYAAIKHHDRFHTALALSPHWVLAGNQLVDWMIPRLPINETFRIWMSRGTKGLDALYKPFQERADQMMSERGWDNQRYLSKVFHRTSHNERSWASYVDQPLRFWIGGI
jgi:predicted alpha/beta superfamily hydrolase